MVLHKDNELFAEIITEAAEYFGYELSHVEKDYWITKMLKEIASSEYKQQAFFKGGTSLSKAYHVINRFSEDLDLLAYTGNKESSKSKEKVLNKKVHDLLVESNPKMYKPEQSIVGGNFRKLYFDYDCQFEKEGLKEQLEVEIKSCDLTDKSMIYYPSDEKEVSPIVGDYLSRIGRDDLVAEFGLEPFSVKCINPRKTICDKISRLVKLSYRDNPKNEFIEHIRDLYDLYAITSHKEYKDFLYSEEFFGSLYKVTVEDRLMKNSQSDKAMDKAAIFAETNKIFADKDVREAYDVRLKKLFFKNEKMPAWGDIEGRIKEIADRIVLFETYRKERENAVGDVTRQKPTFSKISVYPDNAGHWFIRCKVGGEQLAGEKLSPEDAERYHAALAAKDKDKLAGLREELAEKYLAGQIGNSCERKRSY